MDTFNGNHIILHIDMNSYFASVEQAANPKLRGKPVAVGGGVGKRTIIATASYEARAMGVKTAMPVCEAVKICPELIVVEGDMEKYVYTSREIVNIFFKYTDLVEVFSIDEAFLDITQTAHLFGGETQVALSIKDEIRKRFKLTCSVGIASNKLVAKVASNLKKPDGLTKISNEEIHLVFEFLPVEELCGIGRKMKKHLNCMGIYSCGELSRYPVSLLINHFGLVAGVRLSNMGKGFDDSPVDPGVNEKDVKSISHSYTLPKDESDPDVMKGYLLNLCERIGRRARKDSYSGRVVGLFIRFPDFNGFGKQKDIKEFINDGIDIFNNAVRMFDFRGPIRALGASLSSLRKADQISLFECDENRKKVLKASDAINNKYGEFALTRGSILYNELQKKCGFSSGGNFVKI